MTLDYDDIDLGHVARIKDLSDGERMLTLMLSHLDELEYQINNALGSGVSDVEIVKPKNKKGEKVDVMGGTQVTDDSSLGNKQLPRFAAKPSKPNTIKKPAVKKSRDFTGDSISKNGRWEEEEENDKFGSADKSNGDPDDYIDYEEEDYFKGKDMDKLLPLVAAGAKAVDEEAKMDSKQHERLLMMEKTLESAKELAKNLATMIAEDKKKMQTQQASASKVMRPQDQRPKISPGPITQQRLNRNE